MPRMPDTTAYGVRPALQPGTGVATIGVGDESALYARSQEVIAEGRAAQGMGDALFAQQEHQRREFEARAKIEQEKIDNMRAEDAFTKLRERQLDMTAGDKGFSRVKGMDAVSRPLLQEYGKQFGDHVQEITGTLQNENQQAKFRARANIAGIGLKEDILRHLITEGKVAEAHAYNGTIAVETKQAVANWQSPKHIETAMVRILAAIDGQAKSNGWDPAYTEAVRQEKLGKVHDAVIDQAIASNQLVYAKDWYEKNKGDVDPATAKALQAKVYDAGQRQAFNAYQTGYLGVQDNIGGLKNLLSQVTKDPVLDEARKNVLIGRIQTQVQGIERRQEAAAERADRRATTELNAMITRIGQGWEPTTEQMGGLVDAARGRPQLAGLVNQVIGTANATRAFRTADPIVQEQMVTQATLGVRDGKIEPKLLSTFKSISEAQKTERDQDPTTYAIRQQLVPTTELAAQPLNMGDPTKVVPNAMQARLDLARQMNAQYRTPFKPLTEQERALASATLKLGTPEQKREYFRSLSLATGDDFNGYKAIMAQLAPDDPVTAMAGVFARRGFKDAKNAVAADLLLDGISILRPNKGTDGKPAGGALIHQPPEKDMRTKFDDYVRDGVTGSAEARSTMYQGAQAIYASLSRQAGDRDTGVLDSDRWNKAMEMATGGITKVNGRNTIKPWGMPDSAFADNLDARLTQLYASGSLDKTMTLGRLRDLPLRPIGDGQYVLSSGDADLGDKDGKRIVIDFNQPLPPEAILPTRRRPATKAPAVGVMPGPRAGTPRE